MLIWHLCLFINFLCAHLLHVNTFLANYPATALPISPDGLSSPHHSPAAEVVLVGAGYLQVQLAVLVRVVLVPRGVDPLQGLELEAVEPLALLRVIGVHVHILPL